MNRIVAFCVLCVLSVEVHAVTVTVTSLAPAPATGVWTIETTGATPGSGSIVNLSGVGGNLEANQPAGPSAVKLTTGADNNDRANVFLRQDFGLASNILNTHTFGYSYFKEAVGDPAPAPSLKIEIFSAGGTGDNFGALIYEPNWNQPGPGSQPPPTGGWQHLSIISTTGTGDDSTGGWWWNGGFDQPSGSGGVPIKSLSEWTTLFASDPDFTTARVVGIGVGLGSFNNNQVGYFDNVFIEAPIAPFNNAPTNGFSAVYDFESAPVIPEPASATLLMAGMVGFGLRRRRYA
ncbi:MAG: hypothetical protein RJA61_700 [Candidatus Parcubacteria bacterium]|jgi:hypothetical protein